MKFIQYDFIYSNTKYIHLSIHNMKTQNCARLWIHPVF